MTWLYKILLIGLISLSVYLIYANRTLKSTVSDMKQSMIDTELTAIKNRESLIDSLQKSKILITKEILQNSKNIQKLKDELSKTGETNLSVEDAKKLLGL